VPPRSRSPDGGPGLGGEGELADDQRRAADVEERAVHPALGVAEDAQVHHLSGEERRLGVVVVAHRADEDHEAGADLAGNPPVDLHPGPGRPLDQRSHRCALVPMPMSYPRARRGGKPRPCVQRANGR